MKKKINSNIKKINKLDEENKRLKSIINFLHSLLEFCDSIEEMRQANVGFDIDIDYSLKY